jgi:hypothetical protein
MLKEQCTDAAPLVGGFDREPHLRPWRRCVEGSVRADALVATDAYAMRSSPSGAETTAARATCAAKSTPD